MTRFQSVIVASTLVVCLGVGLWASQRTSRVIPADSSEPSPLLLAVAEEALVEDEPGIISAVATESAVSPRKLTTDDAAPVKDHPVRRTIDRLMPNASAEERQIWFEELQSLPVSAVEDLLRLRKESNAAAPLRSTPEPLLPSLKAEIVDSETIRALQRYRMVLMHNLLNADTPGYRAQQPRWLSRPLEFDRGLPGGLPEALRWQGTRLDVRPGAFEETERPLDLAIDGPGWFILEDEHGDTGYTRHGAFRLNHDRQLVLATSNGLRKLFPGITLPEKTVQVFIDTNGSVYGRLAGESIDAAAVVGRISLARFLDDSALELSDEGLYRPRAEAGLAERRPAGEHCGTIRLGMLERSNVNREAQERTLERIEKWLAQPEAEHP